MATRKEIIEVEVKGTGQGVKQVEKLDKTIKGVGKTAEKSADSVEGIGKAGQKSKNGLKAVSTGIKGIGLALKAAGIGLIVGLFVSLGNILSQNQKVMDTLNTVTTSLSLAFNAITDAIGSAWQSAKDATGGFDAMKKVIGGLLKLAITPLKLSFFAIKAAIISTQLNWEKSFLGKGRPEKIQELTASLKEVQGDIKRVGDEAITAGLQVVNNFSEAVSEVGSLAKATVEEVSEISVKSIIDQAKAMVELKNTAELAVAQQSLLVEKYDIQAEQLRQIRDEERNSINDRITANNDLLKTLDDQEDAMISLANLQIQAAQQQFDKTGKIEDEVALIDALANKQGVLAQVEGFRSEQKANDLALDRERIELNNSLSASESKLAFERKKFNAEQIEDEKEKLLALQEIELEFQEFEALRLENIVLNANAGTQAKIDAQIALDEFLETSRQTNITASKAIADQEIELEKKKTQSKTNALNSYIQIAGAESRVGKALFLAKQLISIKEQIQEIKNTTRKGAKAVGDAGIDAASNVSSASKVGFPWNLVTIASAIVQGVSIMKSVKSAVGKAGASSVPATPSISIPSQAVPSTQDLQTPQFNAVGSSGINQLAQSLGEQEQNPVQAFVVSGDVTSAQEMNRNIIQGARIG